MFTSSGLSCLGEAASMEIAVDAEHQLAAHTSRHNKSSTSRSLPADFDMADDSSLDLSGWSREGVRLLILSIVLPLMEIFRLQKTGLISSKKRLLVLEALSFRLPAPASSLVPTLIISSWTVKGSDLLQPWSNEDTCILAQAARICSVESFQVIAKVAEDQTAWSNAFLERPLPTPLREAVESGNEPIVDFLLKSLVAADDGSSLAWTSRLGLTGCNCKLRHTAQFGINRFQDPDDPTHAIKAMHSHGSWEADVLLVALTLKRDRIAHMLLDHWPTQDDAPWVCAVMDKHLESCIQHHCDLDLYERILKRRTYLIPFDSVLVRTQLPTRAVASVKGQVWRCAIASKNAKLMEHLLRSPMHFWGNVSPTELCLDDACVMRFSGGVDMILQTDNVFPTRSACTIAAGQADAACLKMLLERAKEFGHLKRCLLERNMENGMGVLHYLCQAQPSAPKMLFDTFRVLFDILQDSSSSSMQTHDTVVLDDLSWFDEHDHLPIHYATGPFHDMLARLFPADALWNQLEIRSELLLQPIADIHAGGGSKAAIEKWSYVDRTCHVAVKWYPKSKMQEIKRELGIMSRVRFPYVVRVLGWYPLEREGDDHIGVVMDAHACNLFSVLGKGSPDQMCLWMRQVGSALKYLHAQHPPITHGDIHPMNILLSADPFNHIDEGDRGKSIAVPHAVLCDFDFSSIQGTKETLQSKLSLFVHLFRHSDCEDGSMDERDFTRANDWILFGFLLFSVSSQWNWRDVQRRADMKDRVALFASLGELEVFVELPCGAFAIVADFLLSQFNPSLQGPTRNLDRLSSQLRALEKLPWGKWEYGYDENSESSSDKDSTPSA